MAFEKKKARKGIFVTFVTKKWCFFKASQAQLYPIKVKQEIKILTSLSPNSRRVMVKGK